MIWGREITVKKWKSAFDYEREQQIGVVSMHLSFDQFTVGSSILLTTTSSLETPKVFASWTCSRVCPPRSYPVSNSPFRAEITYVIDIRIQHHNQGITIAGWRNLKSNIWLICNILFLFNQYKTEKRNKKLTSTPISAWDAPLIIFGT